MKKHLFFLGFLALLSLQVSAVKKDIRVVFQKTGERIKKDTPHRSPMMIPVTVTFDDESQILEVLYDGEGYIIAGVNNQAGEQIYSATSQNNVTFDLSNREAGVYTVVIEGESWVAEGTITKN